MKLINNWQKMYKSLAVILPTVAVLIGVLLNALVEKGYIDGGVADIVQAALATDSVGLAVIVLISGFIGRIIKQNSMGKVYE